MVPKASVRATDACISAPPRPQGLELFSTCLWHLKREAEASHLAAEALSLDRLCPAAWCCAGNALSLQREHEAALQLFQRCVPSRRLRHRVHLHACLACLVLRRQRAQPAERAQRRGFMI